MMGARQVDASPVLATGSVTADPETVEVVTRSRLAQAKVMEGEGIEEAALAQGDTPSAA
jgi:hypothetical protein